MLSVCAHVQTAQLSLGRSNTIERRGKESVGSRKKHELSDHLTYDATMIRQIV